MPYRVMCGQLVAGTIGGPGTPVAATTWVLEDAFVGLHPARLLLLELVELSPVLLIEIAIDWYVAVPEWDGQ